MANLAHETRPASDQSCGRVANGADRAKGALSRTLPPKILDHELLRCIGQGSYGEVWLARSVLGEFRAIKVVYRQTFEHERPYEREFEGIRKFEPISRLHDSQVDILHVGRNDEAGYFYYVMELADDGETRGETPSNQSSVISNQSAPPNTDYCLLNTYQPRTLKLDLYRRGRLPVDECISIGLALTTALEHLHSHGLVHRDVKPSNIIFVGGVPKLADIGLVASTGATMSFVGTSGFLPPEGPGTPQGDLYSLGKVLYEISTGQDRQEFPRLPPNLTEFEDQPRLLELNAVILKACHQDPRQRYSSAQEMAADLALLQRGKSVKEHLTWQKRLGAARKIGLAAVAVMLFMTCLLFLWQTIDRRNALMLAAVNDDGTVGTKNAKAVEAYQLGLSGLRLGTPEGFRQAFDHFTSAIEADPKFVAAHARLFESHLMSEDHGISVIDGKTEQLNRLSGQLVAIDPTNAETHAALAIVHFVNEWKWAEAEYEFKQALKADPNCRMALTYYGYFLTRLTRASQARDLLERALKLNPTSPLITKFLGHCEFVGRHYEAALPFYQRASELMPLYPSGHYWAGRVCLASTNYSQALYEFEQHELRQGQSIDYQQTESRYKNFSEALEKGGTRGYWRKRIELAKTNDQWLPTPYRNAEPYARLGDKTQTLGWLEKALAQHDSMEHLLFDEFWDGFRQDQRFKEILKKVGLDSWAR